MVLVFSFSFETVLPERALKPHLAGSRGRAAKSHKNLLHCRLSLCKMIVRGLNDQPGGHPEIGRRLAGSYAVSGNWLSNLQASGEKERSSGLRYRPTGQRSAPVCLLLMRPRTRLEPAKSVNASYRSGATTNGNGTLQVAMAN